MIIVLLRCVLVQKVLSKVYLFGMIEEGRGGIFLPRQTISFLVWMRPSHVFISSSL